MQLSGLLREIVNATMHIGIDVEIFLAHGIEHLQGLLRGSSIIEVHEPAPVYLALKDGKILSN